VTRELFVHTGTTGQNGQIVPSRAARVLRKEVGSVRRRNCVTVMNLKKKFVLKHFAPRGPSGPSGPTVPIPVATGIEHAIERA